MADELLVKMLRMQLRHLELQRKLAEPALAFRRWTEPLHALQERINRDVARLGWSPEELQLLAKIAALEAELAGARPPPVAPRTSPPQRRLPNRAAAPVTAPAQTGPGRRSRAGEIVGIYVRWVLAGQIAPTDSYPKISRRLIADAGSRRVLAKGLGEEAVRHALTDAGLNTEIARRRLQATYKDRAAEAVAACLAVLAAATKPRRKRAPR